MKIKLHEFTIGEIAQNYIDNAEEGVVGFKGRLNIRPKYQREFVYDEVKRNAVINTIRNNFPLNVMYWVKNPDDTFEVLDGQQRTISFCQYINNGFSVLIDGYPKTFSNLTDEQKNQILNYKLMIYICEGTDTEKLSWFRIINISGEKLTNQELRNATYTGPWLTHAKSIFSKNNGAAVLLSKGYVTGSAIRQELLEKAISWISRGKIENYMSEHQFDPNANELWMYFRNIIEWVQLTFIVNRKEMKTVDWGMLYEEYKDRLVDVEKLEKEIAQLMIDDDVTKKSGIYLYIFSRNEKYLNIRDFSQSQRRAAYEKQKGICAGCAEHFSLEEMHADHITPWSKGGKTNIDNCQMLCAECNRRKSNI